MKKVFLVFFLLFLTFPYPSYPQTKIKVLNISGDIISPVTLEYLKEGLNASREEESLLIIAIDTPGGLLKSTEEIVKLILNSPTPIITYIYPKGARAASAGVFIGYSSHILVMGPSTHIGAAHPIVGLGSWGNLDPKIQEKITNDTLAWAKNIAETRKKPFSFLKNAIEESLSITETEALEKGVCDFIAEDIEDLIKKIDGLTVETSKGRKKITTQSYSLQTIDLNKRNKILNALIDPNIAYLLLTLGFLGLIFEVTHPGFGFPGIAGTICLILAFYALSILPVNYAGIVLIILGLIFFITEAFTPTFGLFALGGAVSFFFGSIMLFNQPKFISVSLKLIIPLIISLGVFSLFILSKVIAIMRQKPSTGKEALAGKIGEALTKITAEKTGKVLLEGSIWKAKTEDNINKGDEVLVMKSKGLTLYVKSADRKGG
ncbi:MAG: nodulation protein NfeD [Candidatus Omnitrophica bacterium]|jgi:membrane-bound serine protease (ClpP class)|nr:nodulation protein NfeD [Candidatus Omnitrophota bacterium]